MSTDEVRVGDRYTYEDRKITISRIEGKQVWVEVMNEAGAAWSSKSFLPLPTPWVKAGSGPVTITEACLSCEIRAHEPGMDFCATCIDEGATQWAHLTPDEIKHRIRGMRVHQIERLIQRTT